MKRLLLILSSLWLITFSGDAQVRVEFLPEPGFQPQVSVSVDGIVHLVYFKGDPKTCNIRYTTRRVDGVAWSVPVTVNSEAGSAIASGTIRGAQSSRGDRPHRFSIYPGHARRLS